MAEDKEESKPSAKKKESTPNQKLLRYIAIGVWLTVLIQLYVVFTVIKPATSYTYGRVRISGGGGSVWVENWPDRSNCGSRRDPCYVRQE